MAINLTEGAIQSMCNGDHELKPILQVHDIRLVNTQSGNSSTTERFRLLLSDGYHLQQGMLATQKNDLVKSGKLIKDSIILLKQYVCNVIQKRTIIIIIDLEVLQEVCSQIGDPKQYVPPSGDQTGMNPVNAQPSNAHAPVSVSNPRPSGVGILQQPKVEHGVQTQSYGGSVNNSISGQYTANVGSTFKPRPEFASGNSVNNVGAGSYGSYGGGLQNTNNSFSRAPQNTSRFQQPTYQQPPSMYVNRGPIAKNEAPPRVVPIAALNPYQGRWTIKARVTAKADLRHFNNPRGDGKVFSFDLLDSDGGEIRVTCFNAVADQFYDVVQVGKVYLISKGSLKPAQKNFNHLPNDHEIWLDTTSLVQPDDDDTRIPKQQFHFRTINEIESMDSNAVLDVIGVVSSISPSTSIMTKRGNEIQKRSLQLKDMSGRSVELTLWGNLCNSEGQTLQNICDNGNFPVLAVKSAKVGEFNGKNLGTLHISQLFIEPDFPEAKRLKEWFEREGRNTPSVSISRESAGSILRNDVRSTISQIKDEKLGTSEKPDWITVCATVTFVKMDSFCYTSCPNLVGDRPCLKKVTNNGDGTWRCDKCDQNVGECDYRYVLQLQIQDHTATTWLTAFQEHGEEIMGVSAKDLYFLKYEAQDDEKFNEIGRAAVFKKYIFKLKVKEETFNDEQRVKSTVVKAEKADFASESRFLIEALNKFKAGDLGPAAPKSESTVPYVGANRTGISQSVASGVTYGTNPGLSGRETGMYNSNTSQYVNQYSGGYGGGTSSSMMMTCSSCGGTGHSAANCPSINHSPGVFMNQTVSAGSNTGQCYKCQKIGHFARDCPGLSAVPPAYGGSNLGPGRYGSGIQRQQVGGF